MFTACGRVKFSATLPFSAVLAECVPYAKEPLTACHLSACHLSHKDEHMQNYKPTTKKFTLRSGCGGQGSMCARPCPELPSENQTYGKRMRRGRGGGAHVLVQVLARKALEHGHALGRQPQRLHDRAYRRRVRRRQRRRRRRQLKQAPDHAAHLPYHAVPYFQTIHCSTIVHATFSPVESQ